jgi:hypothetical protein
MLQLCYLGIAFAAVFYVVFGIAVRLMDLNDKSRNLARLVIIISSLTIVMLSSLVSSFLNLRVGIYLHGILSLILFAVSVFILLSIIVELHNINTKIKIRRFMVLFDKVERFINEGKTQEEIMFYLTEIQKLTRKEASDFLIFISDPTNHQFLTDVNEQIQEAKLLTKQNK